MPRKKGTPKKTLYVYLDPANYNFARAKAKDAKLTYSGYINTLLKLARTKSPGTTKARAYEG